MREFLYFTGYITEYIDMGTEDSFKAKLWVDAESYTIIEKEGKFNHSYDEITEENITINQVKLDDEDILDRLSEDDLSEIMAQLEGIFNSEAEKLAQNYYDPDGEDI